MTRSRVLGRRANQGKFPTFDNTEARNLAGFIKTMYLVEEKYFGLGEHRILFAF